MKIFRYLLLLLLLPAMALAEPALHASAPCLAVNSTVDFTLQSAQEDAIRYVMYLGEDELFTHETAMTAVSYVPRQSGEYTLRAETGGDVAEVSFTVTEALTLNLADLPETVAAGTPVFPAPMAQGGSGEYSYVYAVTCPDGLTQAWQANDAWHWVPENPGLYTLQITVTDSIGAQAAAEAAITVTDGPGISVRSTGGGLLAHGGQKSWQVYAPGPWTAATEDNFITIDTPSGASGGTLSITIPEPTGQPRQGSIIITSGSRQLVLPVTQSATHGVDEEITLGTASPILAEGDTHTAWLSAADSRSFAISGAGWQAETGADFLTLASSGASLTVSVDAPVAHARHGLVAVHGESSSAYIHVYQPASPTDLPTPTPVQAPGDTAGFTLHSQCSGYWKEQPYGKSNLEQSGCAIFALSHVLQKMGFEGEAITPQYLAANYSFALREGGTINATLVGNVGDDLGYKTRYELYNSLPTIQAKLREGAMFTFEVANGHIAAVVELSEDGSMCRIIDSAPSATFERIKNASIYRREADGSFIPVTALTELENMRYYIETDAFGGAEYYLETSYVARRGVRLIQLRE